MPSSVLNRSSVQCLLALLMIFSAVPTVGIALDAQKAISQFNHRRWRAEHGIGEVYSVGQTTDGYLWLATSNGTFRFDGVHFTRLDSTPSESPEVGSLPYHLLGSRDGSLWISRGERVVRLRDGKDTVYSVADGLPGGPVDSIREENDGAVWVAALSGISRFSDERWQRFGAENGLPHGPHRTTLMDGQHNLWTIAFEATPPSSGHSVFVLRPGETTFRKVGDGEHETYMLAEAPDGKIWAAQWPRHEVRPFIFDDVGFRFVGPEIQGLSRNILFDRDGGLWIGTMGTGLRRVRDIRALGQTKTDSPFESDDTFTHKDGLSSDHVWCIFEGAEGEIWVGTSGGLDLFTESKFITYSTREGLSADQNLLVQPASDKGIWVAAPEHGFDRIEGEGQRIVRLAWCDFTEPRTSSEITSLYSDPQGGVLAGTSLGILAIRSGDSARLLAEASSAGPLGNVLAMTRDQRGALWICDEILGVQRLQDGRAEAVSLWSDGTATTATICHADQAGRIWFGVIGRWDDRAALVCYDHGRVQWYGTQDGLFPGKVLAMLNDSKGQLWIAGRGGLSRFNGARFHTLTREQGLPDDEILALLEDDHEHFWLAVRAGIFRVSVSQLDSVLSGKSSSVAGELFSVKGGPRTYVRSLTGMRTRAFAAKSSDGRLWFPTNTGVTMIHPGKSPRNTLPPPVHIQHIVARGKSYRPTEGLVLPARTQGCEFQYIGLCFTDSEKIRYQHKLEGYDERWIDAGAQRQAFYSGLDPGTYRFRVRASNNDGVWNENGDMLEFTIAAAFYQRSWFPLVWLLPAALVLWSLHRLRLSRLAAQMNLRLESQAMERKRIARELHDTLLQGFIGIGLKLEAIATNLPESLAPVREQLRKLLDQSDHYLTEARRSVMELRSGSFEEGDELSCALASAGERLTEGRGIAFCYSSSGTRRKIPPSVGANLLRIGEEAVSNATRHASPTKIEMSLMIERTGLSLRVRDDGCGFDQQGPAAVKAGHFGLIGMRERVRAMGGNLTVTSRLGEGTEIVAKVPLR